jgi:hypothetical protein
VIESGGMNYWESGMDLHMSDNIFDSFKKYQKILIQSYDDMAEQYRFEVIDARRSVGEIQQDLRTRIENVMRKTKGNLTPVPSDGIGEKAVKSNVESLNARQIEKRLEAGLSQLQSPNGAELAAGAARPILTEPPAPAAPKLNEQLLPFSNAALPSARSPEDSESTNSA